MGRCELGSAEHFRRCYKAAAAYSKPSLNSGIWEQTGTPETGCVYGADEPDCQTWLPSVPPTKSAVRVLLQAVFHWILHCACDVVALIGVSVRSVQEPPGVPVTVTWPLVGAVVALTSTVIWTNCPIADELGEVCVMTVCVERAGP